MKGQQSAAGHSSGLELKIPALCFISQNNLIFRAHWCHSGTLRFGSPPRMFHQPQANWEDACYAAWLFILGEESEPFQ